MLVALPLVTDLRFIHARAALGRLMKVINKSSTSTTTFKLSDLLDLRLHEFVDDVGEIVDQAQKEEKMEQL